MTIATSSTRSVSGFRPLISMSIQMRCPGSCAIIHVAFRAVDCVTARAFPFVTTFGSTFLAVLLLAAVLRVWLARRQVAHVQAHRSAVPPQFAGEVSLEAHQRAADYTSDKTRLAML